MTTTMRTGLVAAATLVAGLALGALLFGDGESRIADAPAAADHDIAFWTCSMHPEVHLPGPGACPICHMELIPVRGGAHDGPLVLAPRARTIAGIETTVVARHPATTVLELTGRLTWDETVVARVSSTIPGRIERLFVDVTGTRVKRGDHLLRIFSRELYAGQKELVTALDRAGQQPEGSVARRTLDDTARAAEERLLLFGMTRAQIDALKSSRAPSDTLTLFAPRDGIVVERTALPGQYVTEGTPLYTVADLTRLWVDIDVFETDLPLVREGQRVEIEAFGSPGAPSEARVVLVAPVVDANTRAIRVRADIDNRDGRLKPGMLVRARVTATVDEHGDVVVDDAGALPFFCPMHPEIQATKPGTCRVCGMALERRAPRAPTSAVPPLVIPATAPLFTGRRAVVYVETARDDGAAYEGREVTLGPRVDAGYVVLDGLLEGERVVSQGAFKIDAAMQIEARPSMLRPDGLTRVVAPAPAAPVPSATTPAAARAGPVPAQHPGYRALVDAALAVEDALTTDDLPGARAAASTITEVSQRKLPVVVAPARVALTAAADALAGAPDLAAARIAFAALSEALIPVVERAGVPGATTLFVYFCPMAIGGTGARWIEDEAPLSNPYFGPKMLRCGEERARLAPPPGAAP